MAAPSSKTPAIGSTQWVLEERQHSQGLVAQELEDFGFAVRNELEWLNEHMAEISAHGAENNLEVFKTPGKLRGKTPRTARKKAVAELRQPLADIFTTNPQSRPSTAQQSLKANSQKNGPKAKFLVAEDLENASPLRSPPIRSPAALSIFSQPLGNEKENRNSPRRVAPDEEVALGSPVALKPSTRLQPWSPIASTQETVPDSQDDHNDIFTQEIAQSTQATQPTQSFRRSTRLSSHERRETGDSFVSAKEAFGSKDASKDNLGDNLRNDDMDIDEEHGPVIHSDSQQSVVRHDISPMHTSTPAGYPEKATENTRQTQFSEQYSISAETQEALDTANRRAHAPEPKILLGAAPSLHPSSDAAIQHEDTVLHHDVEEQMEIEEDVRSPSDGSSPVKPLVRKSSLTFASLPAREPLIPKKSMGSRTSQVDSSKARSSQFGRFTGGKSLGGSQHVPQVDAHEDAMDVDHEGPTLSRQESETTKMHNKASTQTLKERLNMLNQRNEPPKRISQNIVATHSQTSQTPAVFQPSQPLQTSQPTYPHLPAEESEKEDGVEEDEDDDWISPIKTGASASIPPRPLLTKSYTADARIENSDDAVFSKTASASNPDLPAVEESTTPAGSPSSKRYMDGPLSQSKAKFYSALRAAKEKIIGSSATSAQVKLDALTESSMRAKMQTHSSSDDVFTSPKRSEKTGTSIFSHLRSPSKESVKSSKSSKLATSSSSPVREERRTRSSSERERQKEKDIREKEAKQKQRAEERLREMREKEQSKAAAHHQKTKATAKTPGHVSSQSTARPGTASTTKTPGQTLQASQSRPGTARMNTAARLQERELEDEMMPPPHPPKSLLPTGPGQKLREPKRLIKAPSKDTIPKGKPQKIQVNLHRDRFGQAPAPKAAPAAAPKSTAPATTSKPVPTAQKPGPSSSARPTAGSRMTNMAPPKPAPRVGRPPTVKTAEKAKAAPAQAPASSRADLPGARPVSRMQTVQDATRINVPPVNPAKPPVKRPFQVENDEPLHRPAKRPSQQARSKPVTPAHAQFAQGKIPFAEPSQPREPAQQVQPTPQYPNGEEIELPQIMTDSEDEDSDNDFEQPSWVNTPNLHNMLERQQLVDPEEIFGPIAPLNMEQVFPNKERHKRFRERTSSAYWANDQVTEEERRKEREARERLVREGGWTYNPSPRPTQR